jgi:HK97 family phage prohead protease
MKTTNGLQFKYASERGNAIEGYASRFGERDLHGDVIDAGAYTKTLNDLGTSGHRLPMLWAHEMGDLIGSWSELRQDDAGLYVVGTINQDVERGREALSLVKGGDLSGMSIGYRVPDEGAKWIEGARHLTAIDLMEVSLVAIPAAPRARVILKELAGLEDFAEVLRSAGVSRREAEFVARKSWPAIVAGDHSEIDIEQVLARLGAYAADRRSWR